ncbi:MAG: hypothetical protein J7M25_04530 [Deltaproteobacteria bacterium]|nr:hypothetical protein [Deltaproteobacteria bacterium]
MTTVVTFKVADGIVIGADSAMTTRKGRMGTNRYDSYQKINQVGRLPVVCTMWGAGLTAGRTTESLVDEFAHTHGYAGEVGESATNWTVEDVARSLKAFIEEAVKQEQGCDCKVGRLDLLVSGYSSDAYKGEQWQIRFPQGVVRRRQGEENLALTWDGVNDDIRTLWWGHHPSLRKIMTKNGVSQEQAKTVISDLEQEAAWGPVRVDFSMPVQDAAQLVEFLVSVQIAAERFKPGPARSAAPIDLVVVRYDGVHWLRRKGLALPYERTGWSAPA